jgi:hypothetical protein
LLLLQARQLAASANFHSVVLSGVKQKARQQQAAIDAAFQRLPTVNGSREGEHAVAMARVVPVISKVGQGTALADAGGVKEMLQNVDAQRLMLQSYASGSIATACVRG